MKAVFISIALICVLLLDTSSAAPFADESRTRRDVPATGCTSWWEVRQGTTCWETARICGISLSALYRNNGILEGGRACDNLQIGRILCCEYGNRNTNAYSEYYSPYYNGQYDWK